jgi:hypothetical protein
MDSVIIFVRTKTYLEFHIKGCEMDIALDTYGENENFLHGFCGET